MRRALLLLAACAGPALADSAMPPQTPAAAPLCTVSDERPPTETAALRAEAHFLQAKVAHMENQHAAAAIGFCEALETDRRARIAVSAANLLFDSLNQLRRWDDLEAAARRYCAWPELTRDRDFASLCRALKLQIERKRIEGWEKEGRYLDAALGYLKLADANPGDPRLAEILYNAAVAFARAGEDARATQAWSRLVKQRPKDPLAQKARQQLVHRRPVGPVPSP